MDISVRRFIEEDAEVISSIVRRNFLEININDYSQKEMEALAKTYGKDKILNINCFAHSYVALVDKQLVGCGSIASFWGSLEESILMTIFVLPELHGRGIGRKIIETLESDEYFLIAKRVEIPASITACEFYRKLGYDFKDGIKKLDGEGLYRLEKMRR